MEDMKKRAAASAASGSVKTQPMTYGEKRTK